MNETSLKKQKILYELIEKVEEIKKTGEIINIDFDLEFKECKDDFEKQNQRVFNINAYIITKLYKEEYEKIKEEKGQFKLAEYYEFIESLDLPDKISEYYIKMPHVVTNNRILSYITDIPSFMGIIKG